MNVKEFYDAGYRVFNDPISPFTQTEYDFMNELFLDDYELALLHYEIPEKVNKIVSAMMQKNSKYYEAIRKTYNIDFDPLKTVNITEDTDGNKTVNESGAKTTTYNTTDTVNDDKTLTINKSESGTDNTDGTITDAGTSGKDGTVTTQDTESNSENLNTKQSKPTYDDATLQVTDDSTSVNTRSTTKNGTTTTKDTSTISNTNTNKTTVTTQNTTEESHTDNRDLVTKKTGTDNDVTSNDLNELNSSTTTRSGYENIDFLKNIQDIYKSKEFNLYDVVMFDVFKTICYPIYDL